MFRQTSSNASIAFGFSEREFDGLEIAGRGR
jgi:hypothetical protein